MERKEDNFHTVFSRSFTYFLAMKFTDRLQTLESVSSTILC